MARESAQYRNSVSQRYERTDPRVTNLGDFPDGYRRGSQRSMGSPWSFSSSSRSFDSYSSRTTSSYRPRRFDREDLPSYDYDCTDVAFSRAGESSSKSRTKKKKKKGNDGSDEDGDLGEGEDEVKKKKKCKRRKCPKFCCINKKLRGSCVDYMATFAQAAEIQVREEQLRQKEELIDSHLRTMLDQYDEFQREKIRVMEELQQYCVATSLDYSQRTSNPQRFNLCFPRPQMQMPRPRCPPIQTPQQFCQPPQFYQYGGPATPKVLSNERSDSVMPVCLHPFEGGECHLPKSQRASFACPSTQNRRRESRRAGQDGMMWPTRGLQTNFHSFVISSYNPMFKSLHHKLANN